MAGQNPGSPTDFQYFYEDEVYKINNSGQVVFGLVLENYEANSSDQESDVETPIQKGEIRVVWHPSGTERVISEKSVGLADRSLMPGDVVRRLIAGKDTQRGYCRDIVMKAALQVVGTKHVIPKVSSERLMPLEEFTPDLAVCLDSWVGTSKAVHSKLRLVSSDGSRLEYPDLDSCPLEDYSMRLRRSTPYQSSEFYPGQVVYGPLGSLENANWLNVTKEMKAARKHKMHDHKFTVESVITESVSVHWQCRALSTTPPDGSSSQQPKFIVEGDDLTNLKLLNVFEPCTLQVGDRNFLVISPEDTFVSKKQWRKEQSKIYRNIRKETRPVKKSSKTDTNNTERLPSRPKKRASSHRKWKIAEKDNMEVDAADEKMESMDDNLTEVANCPAIKIEPMGDGSGQGSQEDTVAEEKNDSGISPEPTLNGDLKSELANDDDSDNWENTSSDGSDTDSGATWSSRCSSVASTRGKRSPQLAVRLLRGKRLKRAVRRAPPAPPPRLGDRVVVETLHTSSVANVVWQDGTIELGIPSTQLYPIHHLDGQECFPGDFVVSGAANVEEPMQLKHREYGVVQKVDHHGRTAIVHWYRTYTSAEQPVPQMLNESEMSVYDLKDHPDFQYRPGTVVIRVANFTGEDSNCTAGQVIDNFPSGRVKVWWVDGHTSMCWPQDLYKVGEYDSDEGELWASDASGSEDSWETQSSAHEGEPRTPELLNPRTPITETTIGFKLTKCAFSEIPANAEVVVMPIRTPPADGPPSIPRLLEPRVAAHIERGRIAMRRLEEIFAKHPVLQSQEVMRKLLNLYKDCRFLDKLMGTSFFHEDHFLGLLERVRERGASTPCAGERRVHEQLARLFTPDEPPTDLLGEEPEKNTQSVIEEPTEVRLMQPKMKVASVPSAPKMRDDKYDAEHEYKEAMALAAELAEAGKRAVTAYDAVVAEAQAAGYTIPPAPMMTASALKLGIWLMPMGEAASASSEVTVQHARTALQAAAAGVDAVRRAMTSNMFAQAAVVAAAKVAAKAAAEAVATAAAAARQIDDRMHSQFIIKVAKPSSLMDASGSSTPASGASILDVTIKRPKGETNVCQATMSVEAIDMDVNSSNVCYKLCGLIHTQLVKAHAEISRRRPIELAEFLNKVVQSRNMFPGGIMPYHFSVQYGALVVSMASDAKTEDGDGKMSEDDKKTDDGKTAEQKPAENTTEAATNAVGDVDMETTTETAPETTAPAETAPLATAEKIDADEALSAAHGTGMEGFSLLESAPAGHRFRLSMLQPSEPRTFYAAVKREIKLLKSDLPSGVWVRGFEDRLDLLSVMIAGPTKTPYEGGLFIFDVQLGGEYPRAPPLCHYHSYCSDRLNPNLYEDGKVCVSLLGTWSGRGVEVWRKDSSLLQVIVSLQGLILNDEPYFNEAGYEKQKGTQQGKENSRMYNEMVLLKLVQSMTKMLMNPPEPFREEILHHLRDNAASLCQRLEGLVQLSNGKGQGITPPEYPLVPASRGFCLTLSSSLESFRNALRRNEIIVPPSTL